MDINNLLNIFKFIGEKNQKYKLKTKDSNIKIPFDGGYRNEDLEKTGEWILYHDEGYIGTDGKIISDKLNYLDGNKNGQQLSYYRNGDLKSESYFVDGWQEGEQIIYYNNGQILSKRHVVKGEYDGEAKDYFENGQLKREGSFLNNKRHGEWIEYSENGDIILKRNYSYGKEI